MTNPEDNKQFFDIYMEAKQEITNCGIQKELLISTDYYSLLVWIIIDKLKKRVYS